MKIGNIFRKNQKQVEQKEPEEWEKFDIKDFAGSSADNKNAGRSILPSIHKDRLAGMSAHPQDQDLSFDELMAQYHQYEQQVAAGHLDGTSSEGFPADVHGIMRQDLSRLYQNPSKGKGDGTRQPGRLDVLASRQGKPVTMRAQISTADVDRRTDMHRPDSEDGRSSTRGSVRWGDDDFAIGSNASGGGGGRPGTLSRMGSGRGGSALGDRSEMHGEPMGDALMLGAPGFLNFAKQNLLSIPMGAYTGALLGGENGGEVKVLWAHINRIKWLPEVVKLLTALTELRLHDNEIEKVPVEFKEMTSLRRLWLNNNRLERCPDELGSLTALQLLSLSNNPFTELSYSIGHLSQLEDLKLDGLKLTVPPVCAEASGHSSRLHLSKLHKRASPSAVLPFALTLLTRDTYPVEIDDLKGTSVAVTHDCLSALASTVHTTAVSMPDSLNGIIGMSITE